MIQHNTGFDCIWYQEEEEEDTKESNGNKTFTSLGMSVSDSKIQNIVKQCTSEWKKKIFSTDKC